VTRWWQESGTSSPVSSSFKNILTRF